MASGGGVVVGVLATWRVMLNGVTTPFEVHLKFRMYKLLDSLLTTVTFPLIPLKAKGDGRAPTTLMRYGAEKV